MGQAQRLPQGNARGSREQAKEPEPVEGEAAGHARRARQLPPPPRAANAVGQPIRAKRPAAAAEAPRRAADAAEAS